MISRRNFLGHSCKAGLSLATASSGLISLGLARQAAAAGTLGDYRALVCVLLAGGNDSFNMLVPNDSDQYTEYQNIRSDLALDQNTLLPLPGTTAQGRSYAMHPGMPEAVNLYTNGELALLANVGTLLEPVDAAAVAAGARVPLGLYSHADQIQHWQTATPDQRTAEGWGGRIADLMQNVNVANGISMNVSLGGNNVFQSGQTAAEYSIDSADDGAPGINGYDADPFRQGMIDDLLTTTHGNSFKQEYRNRLRGAIDSQAVFVDALQRGDTFNQTFGANPFSGALRQVARVIGARDILGACRQTFFVLVGGWDHHDEVLVNQANMLPWISQGLQEFRNALVELGVFNEVTTFTTSDFGRTLTSNGKGSDHGWGGHHMVMGGSVAGGNIFGTYPILSQSSPLDTGRGVYVPTTPVDLYFAELAQWFGVDDNDLTYVVPNIGTFYSPGSASPPLGFMV